MVSATDGRRAEEKYQPILGGPSQMQATVPEVRPTPQVDYLGAAVDAIGLIGNLRQDTAVRASRTSTGSEDKAAKNGIINDYALKVSNLKSAYDQGKISAQDLNIRSRQLTDEYLKQNLVSAKDLFSVQVAAIGTDVSGKLMDNDIARYEELLSYERDQRREAAEQFKKNYAYAADMSDSEVQIEMQRIREEVNNAALANTQYEQQVALGNPQVQTYKNNADNAIGRAVETNIPMFLSNKIAKQPYGALNPQTLEELRQDCINGITAYGINAGRAAAITDQALRRSGVVDLVNKKVEALTKSDEYNKKVIDTMLSTQKLKLYATIPQLQTLASVPPEVLPFIFNAGAEQTLLDVGAKTSEFIQTQTPLPNVSAEESKILKQALGYSSRDVSVPPSVPLAQITMLTNPHTIPTLEALDGMNEEQKLKALDNVNTIVSMFEDPAMQKRYEEVFSVLPNVAEAAKIKYVQAKQAQIATLLRSIKDSALADNVRYDTKTNTMKLVKTDKDYIWDDAGYFEWKGAYKSLATPYSLQLLDEVNKALNTTTKFVGDSNEIYYKNAISSYSGIPLMAEEDKEMSTPIANAARKAYNTIFQSTPVTQAAGDILRDPLVSFGRELLRNPFVRPKAKEDIMNLDESNAIYGELVNDDESVVKRKVQSLKESYSSALKAGTLTPEAKKQNEERIKRAEKFLEELKKTV